MLYLTDKEVINNMVLQPNFKANEFACPCCGNVLIDERLVEKLQGVRNIFKIPIDIHSAYRCTKHNERVGGSRGSFHTKGLAVDFSFNGSKKVLDIFPTLIDIFKRVGVYSNLSYNGFFHVDDASSNLYWTCLMNPKHNYRYYSTPEAILNYINNISSFNWKKVSV